MPAHNPPIDARRGSPSPRARWTVRSVASLLALAAGVGAQGLPDDAVPSADPELVAQLQAEAAAEAALRAQQAATDTPEVAAARAAHRAAVAELDAARATLEELVQGLADDHAALVGDPAAPTRRNVLVLAMLDSLPTAKARILAKEAQSGRRVARPSRAKILAEVFAEPVTAASPVDERLALWVSRQVADALAVVSNLDEVDANRVLGVVAELFRSDEGWYDFWNRSFHEDLPEALAYSAAQTRVAETALALDRAENPERYGPRGERAPPGMIVVPGGGYDLGPNSGNKRPPRRVQLKPFALDVREVTCAEYAAFVDAQLVNRRALLPRGWELNDVGKARYPEGHGDHPVAYVSWDQANAYAVAQGKRLPTEDEWEAAAAGPEGLAFPWGHAFLADKANGAWTGAGDTLPVESFPDGASPAGCFDMAGNVWEWTATTADGTDVETLPEGYVSMVIRGGGFDSRREEVATRYRWTALGQGTFGLPSYDTPIGFRCAQDL